MQDTQFRQSVQAKPALLPRKAFPIFEVVWALITVFSVGLFVIGWPLRLEELASPPAEITSGLESAGLSPSIWAAGMLGAETILMLGCTILGILLYFQRRKEVIIFFTSLVLITFGTGILNVLDAFVAGHPQFEAAVRLQRAILWSLLLLLFYIFPNGKFILGWSRWAYVGWLVFNLGWFLNPQSPHNPTLLGAFTSEWVFFSYFAWLASGVVVLFLRSQKSPSHEERQQTKWVIAGMVGAFLIAFLEEMPSMFNHALVDHSTPEGIVYAMISTVVFMIGVLLVPFGIAISIQQKHLWQIDYLINRGLVYGLMTILVILGMYSIFLVLTKILQVGMVDQFEWLAVLISALVVIFLFRPLLRWIQKVIDQKIFDIQISYQKPATYAGQRISEKDWTNSTVGRYKIEKFLRGGNSGQLYQGIESTSGKPVAVKFLHQHLARNPEHRKAFVTEAKILSGFDHPNLTKLLDYGEEGETTCYLVMEYLSGQTLADKLREIGKIPVDEAKYILTQLACALDYAHQQGVIHLDIKPSNIFMWSNSSSPFGYSPVLTDFGISRSLNREKNFFSGRVNGTFDYISPEQIHSPGQLNERADIYSLGVVMFQMVTGQLPFNSSHAAAMLIAHINQPPPNPLTLTPEISAKIAYSIVQAMAKDPSQRFENAGLFAEAIA